MPINPCFRPLRALCAGALIFIAALGADALAQKSGDVAVQLTASKIVGTGAAEKLESADRAKPGDVIQYEAVYRNTAKAAVANLQATLPIPEGLELLPETAKPAAALASTDGKVFAALPLSREVKKSDGTTEKQTVPLREIRALRWIIPQLEAGAQFSVAARARVVTNTLTPQAK